MKNREKWNFAFYSCSMVALPNKICYMFLDPASSLSKLRAVWSLDEHTFSVLAFPLGYPDYWIAHKLFIPVHAMQLGHAAHGSTIVVTSLTVAQISIARPDGP